MAHAGGALLLPEDSPFNLHLPKDQLVLDDIRIGIHEVGIPSIALYAHTPCRAAAAAGLSLRKILDLLTGAKRRVRDAFPSGSVTAFVHVDYGEGRKRSYYFDRERWAEVR